MSLPPQIGNYKLDRELGRGGASEVWLGRHVHLRDHVVAIKILMSQERETVHRFKREAAIAARLSHPNIAQLYDFGQLQPHLYTVMEYIEGGSLRQIVARRGRLSLAEAFAVFSQVASALDYAHSLSIVHRDISAANILLEERSGRALLSDFGIARDPGPPITVDSLIMGTPGYLSPEHAQSATSVTHLSDIFGLGVVLYQLLCGELPWPESAGLPFKATYTPPPPLKERGVQGLPLEVDRVLRTLLAADPAQRYPKAGAAVEELRRIIERHQTATQVLHTTAPAGGRPIEFQAGGIEPNEVEAVLGPDLLRAVTDRAHSRADELRDPAVVAGLLDAWSAEQRFRRRPLLGRLARLHKVSSRNLYFYTLRVLYERRTAPEDQEEPDRRAQVFPLEPELERWAVSLPAADGFSDDAGKRINLPGSTRVVVCRNCTGKGATLCTSCKGAQRIYVTRPASSRTQPARSAAGAGDATAVQPARGASATAALAPGAEQVLMPCPVCEGRGGVSCDRCTGIGRLVVRKTFSWSRQAHALAAHDDLRALDEAWLERSCKAEPVYSERQRLGMRPEWSLIAPVATLIAQAQTRCDDETRVALAELTIALVPVTEIVFDLGKTGEGGLYKLAIYGFEKLVPPDWRFFNWERVTLVCLCAFLALLVLILLAFTFLR